jgi:hypothetical protein
MSAGAYSNIKISLNALTPATFWLTTFNPFACRRSRCAIRFLLFLTEPQERPVIGIGGGGPRGPQQSKLGGQGGQGRVATPTAPWAGGLGGRAGGGGQGAWRALGQQQKQGGRAKESQNQLEGAKRQQQEGVEQ